MPQTHEQERSSEQHQESEDNKTLALKLSRKWDFEVYVIQHLSVQISWEVRIIPFSETRVRHYTRMQRYMNKLINKTVNWSC